MTIELPKDVITELPEQVYRDACAAYWETDGEPLRAAYLVAYLAGRQALADEVFEQVVKPSVEAFYESVKAYAALGGLESFAWQNGVEAVVSDLAVAIGVAEPDWEWMRETAREAHDA